VHQLSPKTDGGPGEEHIDWCTIGAAAGAPSSSRCCDTVSVASDDQRLALSRPALMPLSTAAVAMIRSAMVSMVSRRPVVQQWCS